MDLNEVVVSYREYIENIPNGAVYIAEQLAKGKNDEALVAIQNFSEGILWLIEVKPLLEEHGVEVALPINQVQEFLVEINDGIAKQDWVLVADLFEYEIASFFEEQVQGMI